MHKQQKICNIWKVQWEDSYLKFLFAEYGFASTTNKYCGFNATLNMLYQI